MANVTLSATRLHAILMATIASTMRVNATPKPMVPTTAAPFLIPRQGTRVKSGLISGPKLTRSRTTTIRTLVLEATISAATLWARRRRLGAIRWTPKSGGSHVTLGRLRRTRARSHRRHRRGSIRRRRRRRRRRRPSRPRHRARHPRTLALRIARKNPTGFAI